MKLISFAVPCYNSQAYMERCVNSLLAAGPDSEIIIINDGSTDDTGPMADRYAKAHPGRVRVIHQKNQGHGGGVNQGLAHAEGLYYKVVDSDDWLHEKSLHTLMETLEKCSEEQLFPDMVVCNYERIREKDKAGHLVRYRNALAPGRLLAWDDVGRFGRYQNLMMHALVYKTSLLRENNICLPTHTFYVDCLFSNQPIYHVQTLYYIDTPLYQYLVGRQGQSVASENVIRNIDQMLFICEEMMNSYFANTAPLHPRQRRLILDDIALMLSITSVHLMMAETPEAIEKNNRLWEGVKRRDKAFYRHMRYHFLGFFAGLKNRSGRRLATSIYMLADKIYKVN